MPCVECIMKKKSLFEPSIHDKLYALQMFVYRRLHSQTLTRCQLTGASRDPSYNTGRVQGSWGCHGWDWLAGRWGCSRCRWTPQVRFLPLTCWWRPGLWWAPWAHWTWLRTDPALAGWICPSGQPQRSSPSHGDSYPQSWLGGPVQREATVNALFIRIINLYLTIVIEGHCST